jgi:predicted RNase H-like HicB family nuclease
MKRQFDVVIEQDTEGYFVASVPTFPAAIVKQSPWDLLMEHTRDAIELCLQVQATPPELMEFIGVQRITIGA